ncbi:MAG: hypothetical protein LIO46_05310 [Clostridiales bacterium]|nr:hypothetical protein [Clostridiales bacterium]
MRRQIAAITAALMVLFAACGRTSEPDDGETAVSLPETTIEETTTPEILPDSTADEVAAYYNLVMQQNKEQGELTGTSHYEFQDVDPGIELGSTLQKTLDNTLEAIKEMYYPPASDVQLPHQDRQVDVSGSDIESFEVKDNGATYTLKIYPKSESNPTRSLAGSQGMFFEIMENINKVLRENSYLQFSDTISNSLDITYQGGYVELTVEKDTLEITKATFQRRAEVHVTNVQLAVLVHLEDASCTTVYTVNYER